jgi:hypothetical protein
MGVEERRVMTKGDSPCDFVEYECCRTRNRVLDRIASGPLTEDSALSEVLDSLELVELSIEVEESGVEPTVEIKTVRDFLWLCKAMEFQRQRRVAGKDLGKKSDSQNAS